MIGSLLSFKDVSSTTAINAGFANSGRKSQRILVGATKEIAIKCICQFVFFYKFVDSMNGLFGLEKKFMPITVETSSGKTKEILISIKSLLARTSVQKKQLLNLNPTELAKCLKTLQDQLHPKKLEELFPYSILISLKDKQDRRDSLNGHLKSIGQSLKFVNLEAVLGKSLEPSVQSKMSDSTAAKKEGRKDHIGRMGCFMSHLNALRHARDNQYPYVLICEDDVRFMPDKVHSKYVEKGLKELPKDWEICFLGYYEADKKNVRNFSDQLVQPSLPYDNHAYLVSANAYDKIIATFEKELEKTNHEMRACDVLIAEEVAKDRKTFAFKENVAIQNDGASSIIGGFVQGNYQKELSILRKKYKDDEYVVNSSYTNDGFPVISATISGTLYQMTHQINKILNKYEIKFWADGGTILGQKRHGGLIPWDDDVDFSIYPGDEKKLKNPDLVAELKAVGLQIVDHFVGAKIQPIANHPEGRHHNKDGYQFKTPNVDLFFNEIKEVDGKERYVLSQPKAKELWPQCYFLKEEVFNADGTIPQVDFGPVQINLGANSDEVLRRLYGPSCLLEAYQQYDHIQERGIKKILKKLTDFRPPAYKFWEHLPAIS
jgi:GR25 family glycosyltransferase involved in LPS biosynthesis